MLFDLNTEKVAKDNKIHFERTGVRKNTIQRSWKHF